jgi:predicted dithiol-disulfide oxidoreductase (DUF899 family)
MARALHSEKFPGESADYRRARNSLLASEVKLRRQIETVAAQRRTLPLGGVVRTDYTFEGWQPGEHSTKTVRFSELFAPGKRTLVVYSFMFPESPESDRPCPSCTSIIDAIDGSARHLVQRINFAVVAKAPIERFCAHATGRGWKHALFLSSADNTFNRDYHAETPDTHQWPLAHVFVRRGKKIHHSWSSELWFAGSDPGQDMRHVDFMWPMWSIFDLTPEGRGKTWGPELEYS